MATQDDELLAAQAIEAGAYDEGARLLRPLAERNSEYALLTLGWIYETGATGVPNNDAARSYYEHAVSLGNANACHYLGWLLLRDGQEIEARAVFERGAQLNDDECNLALARLNDHADQTLAIKALNDGAYEEAIRLLRPLAKRKSEYALLCLGSIYANGTGVAPDKEAARSYYERAAVQGSATAYFELGAFLWEQGEEARARAAFEAGAERGHIPSMSFVGRMMVDGLGGPKDLDTGIAWLKEAAAKGYIYAERKLLAIEERNAKSIFGKLSARMKIVMLAIKGAREMAKIPYWEEWLKSSR